VTACEEFGRFAAGLSIDAVPKRVVERARLQTAAILAAAKAEEQAAGPFAARAPDGTAGEVYAGAAASIAHDWDDYVSIGHTGHSSVWTARALSPEDLERARGACGRPLEEQRAVVEEKSRLVGLERGEALAPA
jgi:hypothetical protein